MRDFVDDFSIQVRNDQNFPYMERELLEKMLKKEYDLEFLLQELEEISSKEYLPALSGYTQPAESLSLKLKGEIFKHYSPIIAGDAAEYLKWVLEHSHFTFQLLNSTKDTEILPIFTTNYDPAIEEACKFGNFWQRNINFCNGIIQDFNSQEFVWDRRGFEFNPDPRKKQICLFKLHGSVDWYRINGKIVRVPFSEHHGDDDIIRNVIIYPAMKKVAIAEPFLTAYNYLHHCLLNTNVAVFIGYSFRDYDVLSRIKFALTENPNLMLIIFDPQAKNLRIKVFGLEYSGHVFIVEGNFGDKTEVRTEHGTTTKMDLYWQELRSIISKYKSSFPRA